MGRRIKIWVLKIFRKIVDSWFAKAIKSLKKNPEEDAHMVRTGRENATYRPPRSSGKTRRRHA